MVPGIDGQLNMMKNSSLLKWTHASTKNNKNKNGNANWLHPPDALKTGHVVYLVKFLGVTEVSQATGLDVVKEAMTKLRFSHQIKKTEGAKTPKVELTVSTHGIAVQQPKSKKVMWQYPLHQISYCADDKAEKRFFSFIARENPASDLTPATAAEASPVADKHSCFVFVSDKLAEEITLTIGQAFDLAYRRFLDESKTVAAAKSRLNGADATVESMGVENGSDLRSQVSLLRRQLNSAQRENEALRVRLSQVAAVKDSRELASYLDNNGIRDLMLLEGDHNGAPKDGINGHSAPAFFTSDDDFDFDPRAEESYPFSVPPTLAPPVLPPTMVMDHDGHNGSLNGNNGQIGHFSSDEDDFDPRAFEGGPSPPPAFQIGAPRPNGAIDRIPALEPPPRPSRSQDRTSSIASLTTSVAATPVTSHSFTSPAYFDNSDIAMGFSRGLAFGTSDGDFTLDSLDPLKN